MKNRLILRFMFVIGRLHFNDSKLSRPFPSVFVTLIGEHSNWIGYVNAKEYLL